MPEHIEGKNWEARFFYPRWDGHLLFYPHLIKEKIISHSIEFNDDIYLITSSGKDIVKIRNNSLDIKLHIQDEGSLQCFGNKKIIKFPLAISQLINSNDQLLQFKNKLIKSVKDEIKSMADILAILPAQEYKICFETVKKIRQIYFLNSEVRLELAILEIRKVFYVSYCFEAKNIEELMQAVKEFNAYQAIDSNSLDREKLNLDYVNFLRWIQNNDNV